MCTPGNTYLFCSCTGINRRPKNTREMPVDYTWKLTKYLGQRERFLMGKILPPVTDLDNGITVEAILHQLNTSMTTFDFEYIPSERDCLNISIPHPTERIRYFSLIYQDGVWRKGQNDAFNAKNEIIAKGKIRKHHTN
ncbi:hypothetical protein [uncultured Dokdonia sp.]|uniref:hypothetical protein n=1 Tax=uncultured Dokdonia sp. TaxID=575653 RepID=UPI00260D7D1D|nr:hypothetical protein [uncultured Dokdonia sp.]